MTQGRQIMAMVVLMCSVRTMLADEQPSNKQTGEIRVMSFNIRYGTANDGVNHWDHRREFVVDTITAFDPDLLGTQETLKFQRDYLAEQLPDYEVLGAGRDDGKDAGEMMALYFRRDRFEKTDSGHFWLSETPDVIGSKSWDTSLPRMVTWVRLKDRRAPESKPILFFNTHFDHRGSWARQESSLLIRKRAAAAADECRIIITGDFNAGEPSKPYRALFDDIDGKPSPVVDTYREVHPDRELGDGTFSGFVCTVNNGPRIDWIAVSRDWEILKAEIIRTHRDGRTPSDHFPVTAVLRAAEY